MILPFAPPAAADVALDLARIAGFGLGGLVIGVAISIALSVVGTVLKRRDTGWAIFSRRMRFPQRIFSMVLGTGLGVAFGTQAHVIGTEVPWRPVFLQLFVIVVVLCGAYVVTALLGAIEDSVLEKFRDTTETPHSRRVRTQMQMIRRIGIALVWVSAIVGVLMTFPAFRGIGATFFASAGIASIVAGLAAQSALANLFAGVQLAFSDSVRVGDVVVVDGNTGTIEEITLTYIVLRIWDDRRLVLPSTTLTTKPFENWTRRESHMLGTVLIDIDWFTPIQALRIEVQRLVETSGLWDGRRAALQIIDTEGGRVKARATVSAQSSGDLWDLRCHVREGLVEWVQLQAPYAAPRHRLEPETTSAPTLEERRQFVEGVQRAWDEARAEREETGEVLAPASRPGSVEVSAFEWFWGVDDDARQARRTAARADRRASKKDPTALSAHGRVLPRPSGAETEVLGADELAALETAPAQLPLPRPAQDAPEPERTSILDPSRVARAAEQPVHSADSRLYSGSPEAEERAKRMEGPTAEEMAEREKLAQRRLGQTGELPEVPGGKETKDGKDLG